MILTDKVITVATATLDRSNERQEDEEHSNDLQVGDAVHALSNSPTSQAGGGDILIVQCIGSLSTPGIISNWSYELIQSLYTMTLLNIA